MNKLEEAMFAYISGNADVADITARYENAEPTLAKSAKLEVAECQEACQVTCQTTTEIVEPKEVELRICAECRYFFRNDRKEKWRRILAPYLCAAALKHIRNPLTGEDTIIDVADCEKRNMRGNCKFYVEIPDCDLEFTETQKRLYKMHLLKVYWDGFKQEWVRRFGIRK